MIGNIKSNNLYFKNLIVSDENFINLYNSLKEIRLKLFNNYTIQFSNKDKEYYVIEYENIRNHTNEIIIRKSDKDEYNLYTNLCQTEKSLSNIINKEQQKLIKIIDTINNTLNEKES